MLSALWPNTDEAHGLESLTSATTRLRGVIGGQVAELKSELVCRDRDGSAHLDGTAVWSDVRQFLQLSKDGRHSSSAKAKVACEQARSLYAGDLLAGTSYKWVHERSGGALTLQEEYREEYRTVTKRLATLYCDEDRPDLAVTIYRGLLDQEPILEDIVRRLYRCHQLLGDRGAIMREHQQLRDNLRKAFSDPDDPRDETGSDLYEPSAETNAAYAEAMAELDVRVRSASA